MTLDLNDQLFHVNLVEATGFTGGFTLNVNTGVEPVTINAGVYSRRQQHPDRQ